MSLQRVINWLLGPSERQSELAYKTEGWEVAPITIDADVVTSILKGRRLRRRRAMFCGFKSPPGRF